MTLLVRVLLKSGVLDPQGKAIADALHRLGYPQVTDVRAGKVFRIDVGDMPDSKTALEAGRRMAETLLANPVIEQYEVELEPAVASR